MVTTNTPELDSGEWLATKRIFWKMCIKEEFFKIYSFSFLGGMEGQGERENLKRTPRSARSPTQGSMSQP